MTAAISCWTPLLRSSVCCPPSSTSLCPRPSYSRNKKKCVPYLSLTLENVEGSTLKESPLEPVTRRLILLRHADSTWNNFSLRDHDRPLSETGRVDAINVSHQLHKLGWVPELILCSDARRTRETLSIMQQQVKSFLQAAVHFIPSFYSVAAMDGQTAQHLQHMICKFSTDDIVTVMCMGHNKGWEEAASMFTGSQIELKTCNAALLEANGKSWEEAFAVAGLGGWKLQGIVRPNKALENYAPT